MAGNDHDDRATAALLWAAARPEPDVGQILAAAADGADLDRAAQFAVGRRVGPLVWRAFGAAGLIERLGRARGALHADAEFRRVQAGLLVPRALETALSPLMRAGLEPLVFKGPALASRYPEPGLRPMDDIDLIVPHKDHARAIAALEHAGWRVPARSGTHYDTLLTHPAVPDLALEIHWDLATWRERPSPLRGRTLWAARTETEYLGSPAYGLPAEEELVALAIHAGKPYHYFQRLIWSVDLTVVIDRAGPSFDWGRVRWLARRWRASTVLAVGLRQARRLGAVVPDGVAELPRSAARRGALAPLLDERWPVLGVDAGVAHRLRYALWDSRARVAALAVGEITEGGIALVPRRTGQLIRQAALRWRSIRARGRRPLDDEWV